MIRASNINEFVTFHNTHPITKCWLPVKVTFFSGGIYILVLYSFGNYIEPDILIYNPDADSIYKGILTNTEQDANFFKFCKDNKINMACGEVYSVYCMETYRDSYNSEEEDYEISEDSIVWSIKKCFDSSANLKDIKVINKINLNLE